MGIAIAVLLGLSLVAWFSFTSKVVTLLQQGHHAVWVELGSPVFGRYNAIHGDLMRFLFSRRYRTLNDPQLSAAANGSLASLAALIALLIIFLLTISLAAVSLSKGITSHA